MRNYSRSSVSGSTLTQVRPVSLSAPAEAVRRFRCHRANGSAGKMGSNRIRAAASRTSRRAISRSGQPGPAIVGTCSARSRSAWSRRSCAAWDCPFRCQGHRLHRDGRHDRAPCCQATVQSLQGRVEIAGAVLGQAEGDKVPGRGPDGPGSVARRRNGRASGAVRPPPSDGGGSSRPALAVRSSSTGLVDPSKRSTIRRQCSR